MRTLQSQEVQHVSGGKVVVEVDTPQQFVKVGFSFLFGLLYLPIVNVDWTKWANK